MECLLKNRRGFATLIDKMGLKVAAEIGVDTGRFSRFLLEDTKLAVLHSIDCWLDANGKLVEENYQSCVERLKPYGARSKVWKTTSAEAATHFKDGELDFVYIDANHDYEAVKEDLLAWWPKVRWGGVMAGHDYRNKGNAIGGTYSAGQNRGRCCVKRAVDEFVAEHGFNLCMAEGTRRSDPPSWWFIKEIGDNADKLDDLAIKHGTDKSSLHHFYTRYYEQYFSGGRTEVRRLLEIGVRGGCSMKMWKEYFPNAMIFGVDINRNTKQFEDDHTKIFIGSQDDPKFLDDVALASGEPFDIVIDDGSHECKHQIASFLALLKHVRDGGIYVIEDLNTSYFAKFGGGVRKEGTAVEFLKQRIDDIFFNGYQSKRRRKAEVANSDILIAEKPDLNEFEKTIESIHFYSGLAFILKRRAT